MSTKVEVLKEVVQLINQRREVQIARYFTEDFRLDDAGTGVVRTGHAGAQTMMDNILSLPPDVRFEILDTVEGADRVEAPIGSPAHARRFRRKVFAIEGTPPTTHTLPKAISPVDGSLVWRLTRGSVH